MDDGSIACPIAYPSLNCVKIVFVENTGCPWNFWSFKRIICSGFPSEVEWIKAGNGSIEKYEKLNGEKVRRNRLYLPQIVRHDGAMIISLASVIDGVL